MCLLVIQEPSHTFTGHNRDVSPDLDMLVCFDEERLSPTYRTLSSSPPPVRQRRGGESRTSRELKKSGKKVHRVLIHVVMGMAETKTAGMDKIVQSSIFCNLLRVP